MRSAGNCAVVQWPEPGTRRRGKSFSILASSDFAGLERTQVLPFSPSTWDWPFLSLGTKKSKGTRPFDGRGI